MQYHSVSPQRGIGDSTVVGNDEEVTGILGVNRVIVPFLACGDLAGFDADQSYPLDLADHTQDGALDVIAMLRVSSGLI